MGKKAHKLQDKIIADAQQHSWEAASLAVSKVGFSDVMIYVPRTGVTYYIEVKTTDRESTTQKRFRMKANMFHKRATVVRTFAEYIFFRNRYMGE